MLNMQTLLSTSGLDLNQSVLLVTGGSSGMGEAVLNSMRNLFPKKNIFNFDLNTGIDVTEIDQIKMGFGQIQKLDAVNELFVFSNVGSEVFCRADGTTVNFLDGDYDIAHTISANLTSHLLVIRESVKFARERKLSKLNIVLNSSIAAYCVGGVAFAAYCAAKAGVSNIPRNLANLALQTGLDFDFIINAIEPGSVRTNVGTRDFSGAYTQAGADFVRLSQDADKELLGGREVSLENIVNTILYLFFINHAHRGDVFPIDLGLTKTTGARELNPE